MEEGGRARWSSRRASLDGGGYQKAAVHGWTISTKDASSRRKIRDAIQCASESTWLWFEENVSDLGTASGVSFKKKAPQRNGIDDLEKKHEYDM